MRRDTTILPAATVHLQDLEGLGHAHQRGHVAHGANIDLRAGQEGHGAVEIDGVTTLDLIEDQALDTLVGLEGLLELDPAFLPARLLAGDDGFAERILDAVDIDLDFGADFDRLVTAGAVEFLEGHTAFGLRRRYR